MTESNFRRLQKSSNVSGPPGLRWLNNGWVVDQQIYRNDALSHGGSSYRAIVNHAASALTEPGVGANWQDVWVLIAAGLANVYGATLDPTGFVDSDNIDVAYDSVARTVTLTHASGFIDYYWRGARKQLVSPWTSDAHADTPGSKFYLKSVDGDTFAWSLVLWNFYDIQAAFVDYDVTDKYAIRECHGLWSWISHRDQHDKYGTYRVSGGTLTDGTYALEGTTDADNRPGFDAMAVRDEDLGSTVPAWLENAYTLLRFDGAGTTVFQKAALDIYRKGTTYPLINQFAAGAFSEVETATNRYLPYYVFFIPTTSDAESQAYRTVIMQAQNAYTSLAGAQAEDPRELHFGELANIATEFVGFARIILRTNAAYTTVGKVRIEAVDYLAGGKINPVNVGGFSPTSAENISFTPVLDLVSTNLQLLGAELRTKLDLYALIQSGFIKGQMDVVTSYTAVDAGTVTIPYTAGNAATIDASALLAGAAFTVTVTGWPTTGTRYGLMVIRLLTGANVPTVSWTGNVTDDPTLAASEYKTLVLTSWDAGTSVEISEGPSYASV